MYRLFYYSYRLELHLFLITPNTARVAQLGTSGPYRSTVLEQKDLHSGLMVLSSECLPTFCFQDEVLTFDHPGDLIVDSKFYVSGI